jgi:hypothetical protein
VTLQPSVVALDPARQDVRFFVSCNVFATSPFSTEIRIAAVRIQLPRTPLPVLWGNCVDFDGLRKTRSKPRIMLFRKIFPNFT